jgi:predicted DNA-binding transcriptional regulator YafY
MATAKRLPSGSWRCFAYVGKSVTKSGYKSFTAPTKKEAERLDNNKYKVKIYYDSSDETELVIRVLSFGPLVEVVEPQCFRNLIIERLLSQKNIEF